MPRGVYDRTKTKEQRASETKAPTAKKAAAVKSASAPKRKYTKRATADASPASYQDSPKTGGKASGTGGLDITYLLANEARNNIASLVAIAEKFGDLPSVKSEIEAHVEILGHLRGKIFGSASDTAETESDEMETAPAQAVANGVSAPYQASVPLPPPPTVPVLQNQH